MDPRQPVVLPVRPNGRKTPCRGHLTVVICSPAEINGVMKTVFWSVLIHAAEPSGISLHSRAFVPLWRQVDRDVSDELELPPMSVIPVSWSNDSERRDWGMPAPLSVR